MSTKIVEIPVPVDSYDTSILDFDGVLGGFDEPTDFPDVFVNQYKPKEPLTQSNVANIQNAAYKDFFPREDDVNSTGSASSFFGLDDKNNNFLSDQDDFLSPYDWSLPDSPSMDELSLNFRKLRRPSFEEEPTMVMPKQEKRVEQESDTSSSESDTDLLPKLKTAVDDIHDKKRLKIGHNESFSSISSFDSDSEEREEEDEADISDNNSEDEEEEEEEEEDVDEEEDVEKGGIPLLKKYTLPVSLRAENLVIGSWSMKGQAESPEVLQGHPMSTLSLDIKILFGRRKIKYELCTPNRQPKSKGVLMIDFPFTAISGLSFNTENREIVFQLTEPPTFSKKEKGRSSRTTDFTDGNASSYQKHHIYVDSDSAFADFQERLLSCDRRLRQMAKITIQEDEGTFPKEKVLKYYGTGPVCDWDKENKAIKRCEDCQANYCQVCDDVLHRHESQRTHRRVPVIVKPPQLPKARKMANKKRKKVNSDRCRCGTGATKGTLGDPCTGNRCPCFSNGKSCATCGCKNCANPIKNNKNNNNGGNFSPKAIKNAISRSTRSQIVRSTSAETI